MNTYQKIFGSGPIGLFISLLLLFISILFENNFYFLRVTDSNLLRYSVFFGLSIITVLIVVWSTKSLPPTDRGNKLVVVGAFKYFRHPLYGAFLSFFNFGLAFFLNNWIYILWAIIQHPIWHWVIQGEEKLMDKGFPEEYKKYSLKTGRFFPRFSKGEQRNLNNHSI
jgi:protein-S-isoprenylcysteine O-methyltransferase Ste14